MAKLRLSVEMIMEKLFEGTDARFHCAGAVGLANDGRTLVVEISGAGVPLDAEWVQAIFHHRATAVRFEPVAAPPDAEAA